MLVLITDGSVFSGGIAVGLVIGLIVTGTVLMILYKQRKITWQATQEKYGIFHTLTSNCDMYFNHLKENVT